MPQSALQAIHVDDLEQGGDVIPVSEACKFLGVHRNTLYRLIRESGLPAFKMSRGGRWRFRRAELRNWLEDKQGARQP